jgi:predicted nuclease of predicted toxin-antitoxin system
VKLKLDENLPEALAQVLTRLGHDVDTARDEGLAGHDDADVWSGAQNAGRFLLTQDLDFSDRRKFRPGTHHGLLLIRLRAPGRVALSEKVRRLFENEDVESWARSFVVVSERKLRVLRPKA